MCGLVGCAGPINGKHEKAFKQLLIIDSLRGAHSTGVAAVRKWDSHVTVAKKVGNPYELLDSVKFEEIFKTINKVLIGHNRWATQGKVNSANAHPYEFESLVGAHNGTLNNRSDLFEWNTHDVDSYNLYHHMEEKGLRDLMTKVRGAWALTWYDKDLDSINFLRNDQRPLWLAVTDDNVLFWASEPWMLEGVLWREGIKHAALEQIPVDQHIVFNIDDKGHLGKPHISPCASTAKVPAYTTYPVNNGGNTPPKTSGVVVTQNKSVTPTANVVQTTAKVIDFKAEDKDSKNTGVVPGSTTSKLGREPYKQGVPITLTVGQTDFDASGNQFYECFDVKAMDRKIRLYIKREDVFPLTGKLIEAEMHLFAFSDRKGIYYKVEHGTVKLIGASDQPEIEEIGSEEEEETPFGDSAGKYFMDARGKNIPKADWIAKHGTCAACTGFVDPESSHRFSTEGDSICHECSVDPIVKSYVNLR